MLFVATRSLLAASITFLSPQPGTQAIGVLPLEITTDIANIDRVEFEVDGVLAGVARKAPYRVMHDFGTSLDAHVVSAKVVSDHFRQNDGASVITAALTANDVMKIDLVELPLRVRAPRTITAADLRVRENGVAQSITDVRSTRGPARFVFVVDRSLSMSDGRLSAAIHAIEDATKLLRAGDRIELVLFNHIVAAPRTIERGQSLQLGEVTPSGGTSLRDALASVASRQRTYAIVITDGGDRNSAIGEEEALKTIGNGKVIVNGLVFADRSWFLQRAATSSGGDVARVNASTIDRALRELLIDINSRYTIVYQSHGTERGWRQVDVAAATRGVTVRDGHRNYYAQ